MNTKLLMVISSLAMGLTGVILTFLPDEILQYAGLATATRLPVLILQILGALYFAFAMINWAAKASLIGGIYARPIAIGNLAHFLVGALALIRGYAASGDSMVLPFAIAYTVFAAAFVIVFSTHPVKK